MGILIEYQGPLFGHPRKIKEQEKPATEVIDVEYSEVNSTDKDTFPALLIEGASVDRTKFIVLPLVEDGK